MRSLIAVLAATVIMTWAPGRLGADEPTGPTECMVVLKLTDEQATKIADIRKENKPKVQDAGKELASVLKEELEKVREVLTPGQRERIQAFKEERKEQRRDRLAERFAHLDELDLTDAEATKIADIRKEFGPQIAKALDGLKDFLTDEQKKTADEGLQAGKKRSEVIASLNLTDAQKEKIEAVGKDLAMLVRDEMDKIRSVLTETQQEKLQEIKDERPERVRDRMCHRIANLQDLNLTDDQKSRIAEIRKEYRPKVQEAGNRLRAAIREEVEAVHAVLKTNG